MNHVVKDYLSYVQNKLKEVSETQEEALLQAAKLVSDSCKAGGRFYVFGSGHSQNIEEEQYVGAGGLAHVKSNLNPERMSFTAGADA